MDPAPSDQGPAADAPGLTPRQCEGSSYGLGSETAMSSPETITCPPSFMTSTSFAAPDLQPNLEMPIAAPHPPSDSHPPSLQTSEGCPHGITSPPSTSSPPPPLDSPFHTPAGLPPFPASPSELQALSPRAFGSFSFEAHAADSDPHLARQLLLLMSPKPTGQRFQVEQITCNSRLEEAARRELRPKPGEQCALRELEQLQAALEAMDADASEESRVNREVAELVVQRLEDGRRSLHKLVRLLQGLLAAESAYMTAMHSVSQFLASDDSLPLTPHASGAGGSKRPSSGGSTSGLGACPHQPQMPGSGRSSMGGGAGAGTGTTGTSGGGAAFAGSAVFPGGSPAGSLFAGAGRASFSGALGFGSPLLSRPGLAGSDGGFQGLEGGPGHWESGSSQQALTWAMSGCRLSAAERPPPPLLLTLASMRSAPPTVSGSCLSRCTSTSSVPAAPLPGSPSSDRPGPIESLLASLSHLPELISQSHRHLHVSLASLVADCQRLEEGLAEACLLAAPEAAAAAGAVEAARHALSDASARHAGACRAFDVLLKGGDVKGRLAPDQDPWATEGSTARAHQALQRAQDQERACLQRAFLRAQGLETHRLELSKQAVAAAAGSYRAALLPIQHDLVGLMDAAAAADTDAQLEKLAAAAAAGADIASKLTAQQSAYMADVRRSLFCSPEIVLQGPLQLLDDPRAQWTTAHFVLTCAGFLHWFRSKEAGLDEPLGSLGLSRCTFERGTSHTFHVLEARPSGWLTGPGRPRRFSFQAEREECCSMWVAGVKQAIMLATGKW